MFEGGCVLKRWRLSFLMGNSGLSQSEKRKGCVYSEYICVCGAAVPSFENASMALMAYHLQ